MHFFGERARQVCTPACIPTGEVYVHMKTLRTCDLWRILAAIIPTRKDIREAEGLKSFSDVEELKPEQILIIENVVLKGDVFAALPTGFGKSLTFQILLSVCKALFYREFDMPSCQW